LKQARELDRDNATHQLQQNVQRLSTEAANISTRLEEVLPSLRPDLGGGRRRDYGS